MVIKKCAWCQKPLNAGSWVMSLLRLRSVVSHGVCQSCKDEQLARIDKLFEKKFTSERVKL